MDTKDGTGKQPGGTQGTPAPATAGATGGTQAGNQGTQQPRTYTDAEVAKLLTDAKAEWGREIKPIREDNIRLKAEAEGHTTIQQFMERIGKTWKEELEAAKDNPAAINLVQRRQTLDQREIDLTTERANINRDKAAWQVEKTELVEARINKKAEENGISGELLRTLVPDGDPARLDRVVKSLKESGFKPPEGGNPPAKLGSTFPGKPPDSGVTTGTGEDSIRKMIDRAKAKPK